MVLLQILAFAAAPAALPTVWITHDPQEVNVHLRAEIEDVVENLYDVEVEFVPLSDAPVVVTGFVDTVPEIQELVEDTIDPGCDH